MENADISNFPSIIPVPDGVLMGGGGDGYMMHNESGLSMVYIAIREGYVVSITRSKGKDDIQISGDNISSSAAVDYVIGLTYQKGGKVGIYILAA